MRDAYTILVEKPELKRSLESYRRRLEHNIKIDVKESEWECGPNTPLIPSELCSQTPSI
jgi:hypothetical protein